MYVCMYVCLYTIIEVVLGLFFVLLLLVFIARFSFFEAEDERDRYPRCIWRHKRGYIYIWV